MTETTRIPWPRLKRSIVAILRGLQPHEAEAVVGTLIDVGVEAIEIPLNSPEPFRSIETAVRMAPEACWIGAGTVLTTADVDRLADVGGRLMVSPNINPDVVRQAGRHGMVTMPGVLTPTEAFTALAAGASGLKFFPGSLLGPAGIQAIRTVLPPDTEIGAVGGVTEADFAAYAAAGVRTFGLGSSLYRPGMTAREVGDRARTTLAAYDATFDQGGQTPR